MSYLQRYCIYRQAFHRVLCWRSWTIGGLDFEVNNTLSIDTCAANWIRSVLVFLFFDCLFHSGYCPGYGICFSRRMAKGRTLREFLVVNVITFLPFSVSHGSEFSADRPSSADQRNHGCGQYFRNPVCRQRCSRSIIINHQHCRLAPLPLSTFIGSYHGRPHSLCSCHNVCTWLDGGWSA